MTDDTRLVRLVGRDTLRRITNDSRAVDCGLVAHGQLVGIRLSEGRAGVAGVVQCSRIWLCPSCNAKVMAVRALEIGLALAYAQANGLMVIWGSVTCRHNVHDPLAKLLEIQSAGWAHVTNSRVWREGDSRRPYSRRRHVCSADTQDSDPCDNNRVCRRRWVKHAHNFHCVKGCRVQSDKYLGPHPGRIGYVRASEINIGSNGWHPHHHPIVLFKGTPEQAQAYADSVVDEWILGVEAAGGEAVRQGGQQLQVLTSGEAFKQLDRYVTKQTYALALEAVWSQSKGLPGKTGRASKSRDWGTSPHWSLLANIALGSGEHADIEKWWELEEATKGHRMIAWSRILRTLAGVGEDERTDEDIAEEEMGSVADSVCFITASGWYDLARYPAVVGELMTTLESGGWVGLRALLDVWGIEYLLPSEVVDAGVPA